MKNPNPKPGDLFYWWDNKVEINFLIHFDIVGKMDLIAHEKCHQIHWLNLKSQKIYRETHHLSTIKSLYSLLDLTSEDTLVK